MRPRIAIIGGGFAGLSAAYELGKKGFQAFLFEQMDDLGGLASTFPIEGTRLERGYHHWFTNDTHIVDLMDELGLGDRLMWIPSKTGLFYGGKVWDWVGPMDIMRFTPLPLLDRARLGLTTYYLQSRRNKVDEYEQITAAYWLKKYAGPQAWEKAWGPLFRGKFGAEAENIPLVWLWYKSVLRLGSRKGLSKEVLGYPRGSFQVLIDALHQAILKHGGQVLPGTEVSRIVVADGAACGLQVRDEAKVRAQGLAPNDQGYLPFDRIVCTAPSFAALRMVDEFPDWYVAKMQAAKYMATVQFILKLKQPVSRIYWMNIADRSIPFVATIEQTNYIPPETYNGKRVLYISNYLDQSSPYYHMSPDELFDAYLPHLLKINPSFSPDWVEERWHFREAAAQPIVPLGYSKAIPDYRTPLRNLYLANTTQIYPEDRGTNYSVRLGQIIARLVEEDIKS
ncbi:MAG: NAD(P)/FAD-dependent oxidoreductase [Anaerolineae bacterium]|nr:NAD(P)/FAD-dependent oxidoreductase [Anaerolineae bacterium]